MVSDAYRQVHRHIERIMPKLEKPPGRWVRHPFLAITHGKFYPGTICCWDNHHMALRFADAGKPEYLRHLVDTLLDYQESNGFAPNIVLTASGPIPCLPRFHAQPFLAQAALIYLACTNDRNWAAAQFEPLLKYLAYYETRQMTPLGLFRWEQSWMSGMDNDVSTSFLLPESVVTPDINAWIYLEYCAAAALAAQLNRLRDSRRLAARAKRLHRAVNKYLWFDKVGSYAAFNLLTGLPQFHLAVGAENVQDNYAFQSCSNLIPLYARMAPRNRARQMLKKYVLGKDHFLSRFGIRSLSCSSPYYNNAFWGNPPRFGNHQRMTNSNWQGPVWVPLCYFMFHALRYYGLKKESRDLADRTLRLLALSLKTVGSFTENYDAETGKPLYATGFASWNLLADRMHPGLNSGRWIMDPVFSCHP